MNKIPGMGQVGKMLERLFLLPDKPETALGRKVARIVFDLGIILLGVVLLSTQSYVNPSMVTFLRAGIGTVITGYGLACLTQDACPKKFLQTAITIMMLIGPLALGAAAVIMITAGSGAHVPFQFSDCLTNQWCFVGALLVPAVFYSAALSWDVLTANELAYYIAERS